MDFLKKLFASDNESCNERKLTNSLPEMSNENINNNFSKENNSEGPGLYRLRGSNIQESCFMPFPGFYNNPSNNHGATSFIDDSSELKGLGVPLSKYDEYLYKGNCRNCKDTVCQCNNKARLIECSPHLMSTNTRDAKPCNEISNKRSYIPYGCGGNFTSYNLNNLIGENTRDIVRKDCKEKRTMLINKKNDDPCICGKKFNSDSSLDCSFLNKK